MTLSAPQLLEAKHDFADFSCGVASLDEWLRKRARANHVSGASRTYVVALDRQVLGYYCLAAGALAVVDAPGPIRRNMPDPIPLAVLGRLAVDRRQQRSGLGTALLRDAVRRCMQAAGIMGIRGLLAHALSQEAKIFYERHGFVSAPSQPMTLVLPVNAGAI